MFKEILVIILLLVSGCNQQHVLSGSAEILPVIDAHIHLPHTRIASDAELKEFTDNNVVGAVAYSPRKKPLPATPFQETPFPVVRCAAISETVSIEELESEINLGHCRCMKIYLGYVKKYAYDEYYQPFYKLAEKYKLPVVFHTGDPSTSSGELKYTLPITIDEVAVTHPNVNFLIAHMGNPWITDVAEVVYKNKNVYVDTSALLIGDLLKKSANAISLLLVKPIQWLITYIETPTKVLFGTDWPLTPVGPYLEAVKSAVPKEYWKDVFHDNAMRLFKFSESISESK